MIIFNYWTLMLTNKKNKLYWGLNFRKNLMPQNKKAKMKMSC